MADRNVIYVGGAWHAIPKGLEKLLARGRAEAAQRQIRMSEPGN